MRLVLALAVVVLMLPVVAADQDVSVGPARVRTINAQSGTCAAGDNGFEQHALVATVQLTDSESVFADAGSTCSAYGYDDGRGNYDQVVSSGLSAEAGRRTDQSVGPWFAVGFFDMREDASWLSGPTHTCGGDVYLDGIVLFTGCWPNGERPPMLPTLP